LIKPRTTTEKTINIQQQQTISIQQQQQETTTEETINIQQQQTISIPPYCLSLVRLHANIVLLGTSLVRTKLNGERMECNIG
jgi:hypothetical protein